MSQEALVFVLQDVRALLGRPGNDFAYSRWNGPDQAVAEIDDILRRIEAAETIRLSSIEILFAPTGSLEEVSEASGWGEAFVQLNQRFEEAIADL